MKRIDWNNGWTLNGVPVFLPHDAMLSENRAPQNPSGSGGAFFAGGEYLYEKHFSWNREAETCILEFEGIYREADITLNDGFLYHHCLGTIGFYVDLTGKLKNGPNTLCVHVRNDHLPNSRWYTGSGILRPVTMWISDQTHIDVKGIRISTPECAQDVCKIVVETPIVHGNTKNAHIRLKTEIMDDTGNVVCRESTPVTLFPGENPVITQRLYMRNAHLWSVQTPSLYTARVTLQEDWPIQTMDDYLQDKAGSQAIPRKIDQAMAAFGIRHIQADPVHGLRINGETVLLRGACIHADHGILGAVSDRDAEMRRITLLKDAGFNAVRIAHQPASKALLDVCDQVGMLLLEETFDMWNVRKTEFDDAGLFGAHWKEVVEYTVDKDYNHPCVFAYSIGNEIPSLCQDKGRRISRMLSDAFRKADPGRLVTNAVNGSMAAGADQIAILLDMGLLGPQEIKKATGKENGTITDFISAIKAAMATGNINDLMTLFSGKSGQMTAHPLISARLEEAFSHLDICGYNYMLASYACDTGRFPHRIIFGSETNPPKIAQLWPWAENDPANLGDFTWTGWDYLGETGVGLTNYDGKLQFSAPYPAILAYCGDLDLTGYRRPLSYLREIVFGLRKTPYLSVQLPQYFHHPAHNTPWSVTETVRSWSWRGFENMPIHVEIYSPGDEAALLINGQEIGRAPLENMRAGFDTVYHPGKVEAAAYQQGKEIGRDVLLTSGEEAQIKTNVWQGEQMSFVTIQLADDQGEPVMDREREITVATSGCVLAGLGSGNPLSEESFRSNRHQTFRGRLLAAVRGHGTVAFSAEPLPTKTITV